MSSAIIGLGANLGDQLGALRGAVTALDEAPGCRVDAVSGLWRTAAVGGPQQPDYLNAVIRVSTQLDPYELLIVCQSAEAAAHRVRDVRWGPRTLDVDIEAFEGVTSDAPELILPHPRAHLRAFVLAPWAQISPDWQFGAHGVTRSVTSWLAEVADQEIALVDSSRWWE